MAYEWSNTSKIFYEQFVIKNAKSYFRWNLMILFLILIEFPKWIKTKLKNAQILMNHKIKFPWTCCNFEMGLLLTSSFEKKWKSANKTKIKNELRKRETNNGWEWICECVPGRKLSVDFTSWIFKFFLRFIKILTLFKIILLFILNQSEQPA